MAEELQSFPYAPAQAGPPPLSIPSAESPYGGIGAALSKIFNTGLEQQRRREVQQFYDDIRNSGDREKALEVVKNYSHKFVNTRDFEMAFKMVDETWPSATREVRQVSVYDEDTGEETPQFVRALDAEKLTDPKYVKERFGPKATLTKPDRETFYSTPDKEGRVKVLGKMPVGQRPEGAVTLPELTEARRVREEANKAEKENAVQARFEARLDLAERKWLDALNKMGGSAGERERSHARQILNDATRLTALSLNAKILPDGSFTFDDENRTRIFNQRVEFISNLVESDPAIMQKPNAQLDLHTRANKALPLASESPKPPAEPKLQPKGAIKGAWEALTGGGAKPAAKKPELETTPKPKDQPSGAPTKENLKQTLDTRAAQIKRRADLTPEQKERALKILRGHAKQGGVEARY